MAYSFNTILCVCIMQIISHVDEKIVACRKKSTENPREESISDNLEEEGIAENSDRNLSLKAFKRTLSLKGNLKRTCHYEI